MKSIDLHLIKSIFVAVVPYILIQTLINKVEFLYIPGIPQIMYVLLGAVTSKYIFLNYGFRKSFLLLLIPLINLPFWYFLLSNLDGIYLSFLFLNAIAYFITCIVVIINNKNKGLK